MSDEWLVDVLGQLAASADQTSLDWLFPLMDEAHVNARRELIRKGSVSLKGFQAGQQCEVLPRNDERREVVSAQVIEFEQFRLRRANSSSISTDQVGCSAK